MGTIGGNREVCFVQGLSRADLMASYNFSYFLMFSCSFKEEEEEEWSDFLAFYFPGLRLLSVSNPFTVF